MGYKEPDYLRATRKRYKDGGRRGVILELKDFLIDEAQRLKWYNDSQFEYEDDTSFYCHWDDWEDYEHGELYPEGRFDYRDIFPYSIGARISDSRGFVDWTPFLRGDAPTPIRRGC